MPTTIVRKATSDTALLMGLSIRAHRRKRESSSEAGVWDSNRSSDERRVDLLRPYDRKLAFVEC